MVVGFSAQAFENQRKVRTLWWENIS